MYFCQILQILKVIFICILYSFEVFAFNVITGDREVLIVLKVGNWERNYETSINVRIADIYNNFNVYTIPNISVS
jgi:hypothetical protein